MNVYVVKSTPLQGSTYSRTIKYARDYYSLLKAKSKRKPYVRSKYFRNQKVFLGLFWGHLFNKRRATRHSRVRLLPCAVEFIINNKFPPISIKSTQNKKEYWYRFQGRTKNNIYFAIQIKSKLNHLYLMSVFEIKKSSAVEGVTVRQKT